MEKVLKLGGGRSQSIDITLNYLVSERWSVDSHKNKYVNGKPSGQIPVGYSMYIDNPTDYLLEDGGNNNFQITPMNSAGGTSAICSLIQDESGEQIDINIYTPSTGPDYTYHYTYHLGCIPQNGSDYSDWVSNQAQYRIYPGSQSLELTAMKIGWKNGEIVEVGNLPINYSTLDSIGYGDDGLQNIQATFDNTYINIDVPHKYSGYYFGFVQMYAEIVISDSGNTVYITQDIHLYEA